MEVKFFELRDSATLIPIMAMKFRHTTPKERRLIKRSGYGSDDYQQTYVLLCKLDPTGAEGKQITSDAYDWTYGRTMRDAHLYLNENFDKHTSGDVIDIQFINGERETIKESELD
jgi:hypothetical protein